MSPDQRATVVKKMSIILLVLNPILCAVSVFTLYATKVFSMSGAIFAMTGIILAVGIVYFGLRRVKLRTAASEV